MEMKVLDHGYVKLRNISGPTRRSAEEFDADSIDPANSARFSFDAADDSSRTREDDLKLDAYLIRNKHTTPIEMIEIWLEMKLPLFVARQFVRHRTVSINEISARYIQLPNEFYIPELDVVGVQSGSNKQGRDLTKRNPHADYFQLSLKAQCKEAYKCYEQAIKVGIPYELARLHLPVNIYTKWLWKQDLHNMIHFLSLRTHSHAQYEAQQYALAIRELLEDAIPDLMAIYEIHEDESK